MTEPSAYAAAGVDVEAGERAVDLMRAAIAKTTRAEVFGDFGGFAGLFDASALVGMQRPLLATSTDGVGTKIEIARRMGVHDTIGIDLVAMVVDDLVVCGAEPLFMTDYIAVGKVDPQREAAIVTGIATGCAMAGCALLGGETAEHPGLLGIDEYDIAGAGTGVVDAPKLLGPQRVERGDVSIAIAASGLHSNGYSLVRHIAFTKLGLDVHSSVAELGGELGTVLLTPTQIYAKDIMALIDAVDVHSVSHITGGGLAANIARVLPAWAACDIERSSWSPQAIFHWLMAAGEVSLVDAERTFNMGIGMLAFVASSDANRAIELLAGCGLTAWQCGLVRDRLEGELGDSPAKGGGGGAATLVGNYRH